MSVEQWSGWRWGVVFPSCPEVEVLLPRGYICFFYSLSHQELGCWHILARVFSMNPGWSSANVIHHFLCMFHGKFSNSSFFISIIITVCIQYHFVLVSGVQTAPSDNPSARLALCTVTTTLLTIFCMLYLKPPHPFCNCQLVLPKPITSFHPASNMPPPWPPSFVPCICQSVQTRS